MMVFRMSVSESRIRSETHLRMSTRTVTPTHNMFIHSHIESGFHTHSHIEKVIERKKSID
jgi:hypothetical protein